MTYLTLDHLPQTQQNVLVRVDFNMPDNVSENQSFARLERSLKTLKELLEKGHRLILLSHYGRPKGKTSPDLSLKKLTPLLSQKLNINCAFAPDFEALQTLKDEQLILFENIRFFEGEEKNDDAFAKKLSTFGDLFINDAFAVSHRTHASLVGIPKYLQSYMGRLLEEEMSCLKRFLTPPQNPMFAIIGGAKISSKIGVLEALLPQTQGLLIGGAMANTFLKASGLNIGQSLVEDDHLETAHTIMQKAHKLYLPNRVVVKRENNAVEVDVKAIQNGDMIMDIAPSYLQGLEHHLEDYTTFLWNGPLGVFEQEPFNEGTLCLTKMLAKLHNTHNKITLAGGGDSVEAIEQTGLENSFSYISTGGGAFLEFLEGKTLPGIAALTKKENSSYTNASLN